MAEETKTSLSDLKSRVAGARGADREVDGRIMFHLFAKAIPLADGRNGYLWPEDNPSWSFAIELSIDPFEARKKGDGETIAWKLENGNWLLMNSLRVPPLTASVDAALALIERVLPAQEIVLAKGVYFSGVEWSVELGDRPEVIAPTPALALVAALLSALDEGETK